MRLICPKCSSRAELVEMNEDVVFYCSQCGLFRDLAIIPPEPNSKMFSQCSKSWIIGSSGLKAIEAMVDDGMTMTSICGLLGITRPTMYRYAKESEELRKILGIKSKLLIENIDENRKQVNGGVPDESI